MKTEPYLASAHADDVDMLNRRVHDSLPEWDVTSMEQVVNAVLDSKYAAYRHRVAERCNGNPNERMMFHIAPPAVAPKIWHCNKVKGTTLGYEAGLKLARQRASPSIPRMDMRTTTPYGHLLQVLRPSPNLQSAKACRWFSASSAWATSMTWAPAVKPALRLHGRLGRRSRRFCPNPHALPP